MDSRLLADGPRFVPRMRTPEEIYPVPQPHPALWLLLFWAFLDAAVWALRRAVRA